MPAGNLQAAEYAGNQKTGYSGMCGKQMEEKMRSYEGENNVKLMRVVCNQCKKELKVENGYLKEGGFSADVTFGYFSQKDGMKHHFDLCEECYDKLVEQFARPVEKRQSTELL